MKKRFLSILLALCMVLALLPAPGFAAFAARANAKNDEQWKSAYIQFLEEQPPIYDYFSHERQEVYKLVDINGDAIPELWFDTNMTAGGAMICTYAYGVVNYEDLWTSGFEYAEGQNVFVDAGGHMDEYYHTVYSINNGEFVELHHGDIGAEDNSKVQFDSDGNPIYEYFWDGQRVTSAEYDVYLNNACNGQKLLSPFDGAAWNSNLGRYTGNGLCTYDEIMKEIRNYVAKPGTSSTITIDGKSIQSLFSKSSIEFDKDLALFAANLSRVAEDKTGDNILNYYRLLGWPEQDREIYQYGGDRAYSIACAELSKDENLLVITARGSQTWSELFEDAFSFGHRDFFGYTTNDVIYDFEQDIMTGLNQFLTDHEYLMEKDLKILITGHSLGGAAANLNAARFTLFEDAGAWWSDLTEQSDIYCYTFGAINSLADNTTVKKGFENIHNVYNLLDSYGPNRASNLMPSGLGRGYGKFGHMDIYSHNYEKGLYVPLIDSTNHLIENYIDSLHNGYVSCKKYSAHIINGGGVWCPVDLKIYLETTDGSVLVGSITDNQIDEIEHPMVGLRVDGDKKYFYLPDDGNYTIELKGTDNGTMTYFVQDMNAETGEPIDGTGIVYRQVQLTADKQFYSDIRVDGGTVSGTQTEKALLYVLDENGKPEKAVLPDGNGTEVPVEQTSTRPVTFSDVPRNAYFYDAVLWAVNRDITTGTTSTKFSPNQTCTSAEILTFLWRAAGEPKSSAQLPITVPASLSYAEDAIRWAAEKGMVDRTFNPKAPCTRASAVTYIWQAFNRPAASNSGFSDVPSNASYSQAVAWAVKQGVTNGTGNNRFTPDKICNRGQIVTFLYRAYH